MRKRIVTAILLAAAGAGVAQQPAASTPPTEATPMQTAAAPGAQQRGIADIPAVYKSDLDFSYTYSLGWDLVDTKPILPLARLQIEEKATSDPAKRAAGCTQIGLLLRKGSPPSTLVTIMLPYDCLGKVYKQSDLAGFGSGVATGLNRNYEIHEPMYGAYRLGKHDVWIERAQGTSKAHPENSYMIETACLLLKKGAVCWTGFMRDEASLKEMEQGLVTLEGETPAALVPSNAFPAAR